MRFVIVWTTDWAMNRSQEKLSDDLFDSHGTAEDGLEKESRTEGGKMREQRKSEWRNPEKDYWQQIV